MSAEQVLIIGLVASVITQILKLVAVRLGKAPSQEVVNIALFVVAVVASFLFAPPALPTGGSPVEIAQAVLGAALGVVGAAGLIYNLLLQKVVFPAVRLA